MDNQRRDLPGAHNAYRRLSRSSARPTEDGRPAPRPTPHPWPAARQPSDGDAGNTVCAACHAWSSCCFCSADTDAMREALRRIAELHSGCEENMCPERARLAAIPRVRRPAE